MQHKTTDDTIQASTFASLKGNTFGDRKHEEIAPMFLQKRRFGLLLGILGILLAGLIGAQPGADAQAPQNDNFANATVLSGMSPTVNGTNVGATKETGEPSAAPYSRSNGQSVWYRWKAPASGGVTFTATGNFNSAVGIYTGLYVNQLTQQTEFQLGLGTNTSSATFNAVVGTTYYILVDDYKGGTGTFTLTSTWGPANDNFANAKVVSGNTVNVQGTNVNSSTEVNEPSAAPYSRSYGQSVWYLWKAPASGGVTFKATGNFNSAVGVYTGLYVNALTQQTEFQLGLGTNTSSATFNAVVGTTYYILVDDYEGGTGTFTLTSTWGPANDDFANAKVVSGNTVNVQGTNVNSSTEVNEPSAAPYSRSYGQSVWYRWKAPVSGGVTFTAIGDFYAAVGIYTGQFVNQLTDQTEFQPGLGTDVSSATFHAVAGTTYSILVDDYEGGTGTFTLTSTWGPANDDFANAKVVSGNTVNVQGTNVNSSTEVNEPSAAPYSRSYGRSVWYQWTAPTSGGVTFTVTGDFESAVGIYTGSAVASLTNQTEFQTGLGTVTSSATFNAVAGMTYSILVDDYEGGTGTFTLTSTWGPANDNFANAIVISGSTGSIGGTNVNSSTEANEPSAAPYSRSYGRSVWYEWTAPASKGVTFTATGNFESAIGIYTGSAVSSLTNQTQSQAGLGTNISSATFNAVAGTTYYILVDDYEGGTGTFTLSWK